MGSRIQRRAVGTGIKRPAGRRGIIVEFDEGTFEHIRRRALNQTTSFAEQVRMLVEWGLESVKPARPLAASDTTATPVRRSNVR